MKTFIPQVLVPIGGGHPLIVFAKGRTKFHAIAARDTDIALVTLDSLRGLRPLVVVDGEVYPPRRAASYWLNHDHRPITKRARPILRGLVARKPRAAAEASS